MSASSSLPPLSLVEAEALVAEGVAAGRLERGAAESLASSMERPAIREAIMAGAHESKLRHKGERVSVSRNVFIPLTNLCRDRCTYCGFAKQPDSPEAKTYTLDEVDAVVRDGVRVGCIEALMCLGDKPEVAYRSHREWLAAQGYASTVDHLVEACRVAFEGGMLPHTNAGLLSGEDMERLRPWNASMGLMLENTSQRLRERGRAHFHAPDKDPEKRLRMHAEAGELRIPFTSGILLGIGETGPERLDTLLAIRDLQDRYGHIQEVIVQPFHAKPETPMGGVASLADHEVVAWVALARLVLGGEMNLQAPPNLAPEILESLLRAGLNDWGGVSPLTLDFINPEAPWPELQELHECTALSGQRLVERLPIYPEWLERPEFFDPQVWDSLPRFANDEGLSRNSKLQSGEEAA
ncbi:MAG: 7,8-didemethyl-8-hydroxy-5-deazariboflavin synthase CofG [Deltaproteobacteria bacterium]|nr:7,8-didemethyl-8-hydroxy-5-deazariboflavin synthase CofG [Deltaproteobacteria bacterium]MBW2420494.1 7,8-didemethyl-8-hydroxy-5-deazariboflavin synthase CofG [Deltaproteobacteria bacterium]